MYTSLTNNLPASRNY